MRNTVIALTVTAVALTWAAVPDPALADSVVFECPANVRAEVTSPLTDGWVATPQSSGPVGAAVQNIGRNPALVCKYNMFATQYIVWRALPAGYESCTVIPGRTAFQCGRTAPIPAHRL